MNVAEQQALIAATAVLLDKATANLAVARQHLRNIAESLGTPAAAADRGCPTCGGWWTVAGFKADTMSGFNCRDQWHIEHFAQGRAARPKGDRR